jgi:hypothetical protein
VGALVYSVGQPQIGAKMAKFTDRDEIEVELRYIRRVRSMQPSPQALRDLDRQEADLKRRLRALDESPAPASGTITLGSNPTHSGHRRVGFGG